mgnify:FL=1
MNTTLQPITDLEMTEIDINHFQGAMMTSTLDHREVRNDAESIQMSISTMVSQDTITDILLKDTTNYHLEEADIQISMTDMNTMTIKPCTTDHHVITTTHQ